MAEYHPCEAVITAAGHCFAPLGLSESECLSIADCARSVAPNWHTDLHEDALGQPSVIMAPSMTNRLQLALIAYRIDTGWFLDEVKAASYHELGAFPSIGDLLAALHGRLRYWSMPAPICRAG